MERTLGLGGDGRRFGDVMGSVTEVEVASGTAAGLGLGQVRGITMDVEHHSAGPISDACIGMCSAVVKEVHGCLGGSDSTLGLSRAKGAEGY